MQFVYYSDALAHHGIKGQKWGVRRYQNADGSLTSAGRNHYGVSDRDRKQLLKAASKAWQAKGKAAESFNKLYAKSKVYGKYNAEMGSATVITKSKSYNKKRKKMSEAIRKGNQKVASFQKKYGSDTYEKIEKELMNSSALKKVRDYAESQIKRLNDNNDAFIEMLAYASTNKKG